VIFADFLPIQLRVTHYWFLKIFKNKSKLRQFSTLLITLFVGFNCLLRININQIIPNHEEIELLREAHGSIDINTLNDLILMQNKVVEINNHEFVNNSQFILKQKLYKGECYDR